MDIREKFKLIRKQRKISLRELGNIAGSASSISDFENGKTNLSLDIFTRIVEVLQISADWLIMADIPQTMEYSSAELSRLLADCSVSESKAILKMAENLKEILRSQK